MNMQKHIAKDANYDYDALNDSFYARPIDGEYSSSFTTDDVIIDIDENRKITGIEVLNASKKFGMSKFELLHPIELEFDVNTNDGEMSIALKLTFMKRNHPLARSISVSGINDMNLSPSSSTFALA